MKTARDLIQEKVNVLKNAARYDVDTACQLIDRANVTMELADSLEQVLLELSDEQCEDIVSVWEKGADAIDENSTLN